MKKWLIVAGVGAFLALLVANHFRNHSLAKLQKQEVVLDSAHVRHSRTLKAVRARTDSTLPDTCKPYVKAERQAADSVIVTDSLEVTNLKRQVALLQPPKLAIFAKADYSLPPSKAWLTGSLTLEAGAKLRTTLPLLGKGYAYASRVQPITGVGLAAWHVGYMKEWRVF